MTTDSSRSLLASGVRSLVAGSAALAAMVAVGVAAAIVFRAKPPERAGHAAGHVAAVSGGLGLRAEVRAGSLQVSWNHDAASVRNATSGSLTFQDGETRRTVQLNQTTARAGSVLYGARGTQIQVALTVFAPDHVVSESVSAAVPAAPVRSAAQAGESGSDVLVAGKGGELSVARPEAEVPTPSHAGTSTPHSGRREPDAGSAPARDHGAAAGGSVSRMEPLEEPLSAAPPVVQEPAASDSTANIPPGTVAIRVEVDAAGKVVNARLIPQKDLDPAFAEAALAMARDWRFEAPPAGHQLATRILEFRQPANQ